MKLRQLQVFTHVAYADK